MNTSRAGRRHQHGAPQDTRPQPSHPHRVFPDYIYINWEGYMRAADPLWQATNRPLTSCMYQARVNTQGQINTTHRMQQWLRELPEPAPDPGPKPPTGGTHDTRSRSPSAPTPRPGHTPRPDASPTPGVADPSPITRLHHPNPLSQHPVQLEELLSPPAAAPTPPPLPPFRIPQRKSSLLHTLRLPQPNTSPPHTPADHHQQSDLVQGVQQIQLGDPVEFKGTRRFEELFDHKENDTAQLCDDIEMADIQQTAGDSRSASASKRHTVQFGQMLDGIKGHLPKHDRAEASDSSTNVSDSQPPQKRLKSRFGSIRNRFSAVGAPVADNAQDGRMSSASVMIRNFGQASKGFFGKLAFGNAKKNIKIRVAFIGDGSCGKTNLLHHFTTGEFLGENVRDGVIYNKHMAGPLDVDNYLVNLESWDVSAHLTVFQTNPLTLSYFDATVICFDVTDEANLQSVVDKWQHEANVFTPGIPVILVGLKSDLRPPYRTLKLRFLGEKDDEPPAATVGQVRQQGDDDKPASASAPTPAPEPTPAPAASGAQEGDRANLAQGEAAAQSIKAIAYFECSARTGEGVNDLLESMIRICIRGVEARRERAKARKKAESRQASNFFRRK